MTGQGYIRILEAQNKLMTELLSDAQTALHDLGACDDPECDEPNCLRVLQRIRQALAITPTEPPAEKPKRYGCHCDLEPGKKPDDCLIVDGVLTGHCICGEKLIAQGKTREDCLYWLVLILALIYFLKPICIKFWEK